MKRLIAFALVLVAVSTAVIAQTTPGLTGKWEGSVTLQRADGTESGPNPLLFDLTQNGNELAGTAGPPDQQTPIENGAVTDGKVTFEVQPGPLYKFTLSIVDGRLQGQMTGERDGVVRVRGTVDAARAR